MLSIYSDEEPTLTSPDFRDGAGAASRRPGLAGHTITHGHRRSVPPCPFRVSSSPLLPGGSTARAHQPSQPSANLASDSVPGPSVCPSCVPGTQLFMLSALSQASRRRPVSSGTSSLEAPTNSGSWPLGFSAYGCTCQELPTHRASVSLPLT